MRSLWLLTLLSALSLAQAGVLETFDQPDRWAIHNGAERGGSFALADAPDGAGKVGQITWQATHAQFLENHLRQPVAVPELASELTGTIALDLYTTSPQMLKDMGLRLLDANHEVFQFSQKLDLPAASWYTVRYELKPGNIRDSWGANKDGKLDFPLRLLGFSVSFTPDATEAGTLLVDNVRLLGAGKLVGTEQPLWRFDARERWRMHDSGKALLTLTPGDGGLMLQLQPSTKRVGIPLYETKFGDIGEPRPLVLAAELVSGDGVGFIIRFSDQHGEVFQSRSAMLKPGANRLELDLAKPQDGSWGENQDKVVDPPIRLHELYLVRDVATAPAQVKLTGAWLVGTQPALDTVRADLMTDNPIHVLKAGDTEVPVLRLSSAATEPLDLGVTVRLEGYDAWLDPITRQVSIPARGQADLPLPRPKQQGIYWVHLTLDDGEGAERALERSFCIMDPAGPTPGRADGFLFSICTHTERWPEDDQVKEVLAAGLCGAKVIRTGQGWGSVEPQKNQFDFSKLDKLMQRYNNQGMELQLLLGFTARWAAKQDKLNAADWRDWAMNAPADMEGWENYCRKMAEHYRGRVRYWEVWNEPDIGFFRGTLDEYLEMLKRANRAINGVDPQLEVMTGGFAAYYRNPEFIEAVVVGAQQDYDVLAWHRHGTFDGFQQEVDGPVAAMRAKLNPPKPLYFNETAMHSTGGHERMQAEQLVKKLTFAWSRGAIGYTWYDLRNDGYDPTDAEHNYGMVTNDFYPKAVYPVYNTLAKHLTGKQFAQQLELGGPRWAFSFTGGGQTVIAAWDESRGGQQFILDTAATKAVRMDMMGNQSPIEMLPGGRVILDCRAEPGYLILDTVEPIKVLGGLASVSAPAALRPGRAETITVTFRNPLAQPLTLGMDFERPDGWRGSSTELKLAAGAEGTATLSLIAPADAPHQLTLPLRYTAAGQPFKGTVDVPLKIARVVTVGQTQPVWKLADRSQVHNLFDADPNKKHLLWKGADDLSADIWLSATDDKLSIKVAVTDDVHRQGHAATDMWMSDSVQFALYGPGQTGMWEFGLALSEDGRPLAASWIAPDGLPPGSGSLHPTVEKTAKGVTYAVDVPLADLELTRQDLRTGFGFSLLVNDDDGEGRESWIEVSKGIGESKDRTQYPLVIME